MTFASAVLAALQKRAPMMSADTFDRIIAERAPATVARPGARSNLTRRFNMTQRIGIWDEATRTRFREKQLVRGEQCWGWSASLNTNGYGQFSCPIRKRPIPASRFALELHLGRPLGAGKIALHHCDNPVCTNPSHLYEGTRLQNMRDMHSRGRAVSSKGKTFNSGSANPNSKLTEADVKEMRASGLSASVLAARYGVTPSNVDYILRGKTWRHVV